MHCRLYLPLTFFIIVVALVNWWISPQSVRAENPAPGIHWGALAFPDQEPVLATGLSIFRFTEFNGAGEWFNGIRETIGLNLVTTSWTQHWVDNFEGWSSNLT